MKIFIITGMPAAGKNIAAQYPRMHQYSHFSTGDFVHAEICKMGINADPEISLQSRADYTLVAVLAPLNLRLNRVKERGREDDSADYFEKREQREIDYGLAVCIALADAYVINVNSPDDALKQLDDIIKNL
jgi:dephospho-CoA kinase